MIEPHSAQLGASSWILNATFVAPRDSVTVPRPLPFVAFECPFAWPLVATTASSSPAAEEAPPETTLAAATGAFAFWTADGASAFDGDSVAVVAFGSSLTAAGDGVAPKPVAPEPKAGDSAEAER